MLHLICAVLFVRSKSQSAKISVPTLSWRWWHVVLPYLSIWQYCLEIGERALIFLLIQTALQRVCSEWPQADPVLEHSVGNKMIRRFSERFSKSNLWSIQSKHQCVHPNFPPLNSCSAHTVHFIPHQAAVQFPQGSSGLKRMDFQSMFSSVFQFLQRQGWLSMNHWVILKDKFSASVILSNLMQHLLDNILNKPSQSFFVFVMLSSRRWSLILIASFLRSLAISDLLSSSWFIQDPDNKDLSKHISGYDGLWCMCQSYKSCPGNFTHIHNI